MVNYDIPTSSAAYVHRAGRTGRAGREGGIAVTFYTKEDIQYVKAIANAIAASERARRTQPDEQQQQHDVQFGIQPWLLNALPDISKKDRRELKKRGVSLRRKIRTASTATNEEREGEEEHVVAKAENPKVRAKATEKDDAARRSRARARISTKSGYERRRENMRRGAIARRSNGGGDGGGSNAGESDDEGEDAEDEWTGIHDI